VARSIIPEATPIAFARVNMLLLPGLPAQLVLMPGDGLDDARHRVIRASLPGPVMMNTG